MKNKLVATLLSLAMAVSCLTACGSPSGASSSVAKEESKTEAKTEAKTEEKSDEQTDADAVYPAGGEFKPGDEIPVDYFAGTEITVLCEKASADESTDFNVDKPAIVAAEEATGIHVNWIIMESGTVADKMPTILSGENRPDIYLGNISATEISANSDLFYDLSEEGLLETYAPKVVADYDSMGTVWDAITWGDGSIYSLAIGWGISYQDMAGGIYMINQEWLDKVGMSTPTTAEEFLNVLRAFRDEDVDGDGDPSNEIPFGFCNKYWAGNIMLLSDYFGLGSGPDCGATQHYFQLKDGKVVSTLDTDNYRKFIEFVATMVEENLIDVEGFSQTNDQHTAKIKAGTYGVFPCWTPPEDKRSIFVPLGVFQGIEGVEPIISGYGETGTTFNPAGFVIDADTENVAAALHWWNWLSKDAATKRTFSRGTQGQTWDFNPDGTIYEISGFDMFSANQVYTQGFHNKCPVLLPEECTRAKQGETNPNDPTLYRENMVEAVKAYCVKEPVPRRFTSAEAEEERVFLQTDLFAYVENFTATNCMDGLTDKEWDQHLSDLEANGYYDWLDWYQKYVDNGF